MLGQVLEAIVSPRILAAPARGVSRNKKQYKKSIKKNKDVLFTVTIYYETNFRFLNSQGIKKSKTIF
jgi:hypothetical protein